MASIHSLHADDANINSWAESPPGKEYSNQTGNVKWKINLKNNEVQIKYHDFPSGFVFPAED